MKRRSPSTPRTPKTHYWRVNWRSHNGSFSTNHAHSFEAETDEEAIRLADKVSIVCRVNYVTEESRDMYLSRLRDAEADARWQRVVNELHPSL